MEDKIKTLLDEGLENKIFHKGYNGRVYTLLELRNTANEYKAADPNILKIKEKYQKVYNCLDEKVSKKVLKEVYEIDNDFVEEWRPVTIRTLLPYCVSNLGRIAIDLGNGKRQILLQEDYKDFKTGKLKYGYLCISFENDKKVKGRLNHSTCIYNFIGYAFYPDSVEQNLDIHHINNNGYDCRPENLILLKPREHSKAHGFFVSSDKKRSVEN